jgi:hypothetical protein
VVVVVDGTVVVVVGETVVVVEVLVGGTIVVLVGGTIVVVTTGGGTVVVDTIGTTIGQNGGKGSAAHTSARIRSISCCSGGGNLRWSNDLGTEMWWAAVGRTA